jgi:hypothetical protein
MQGWRTDGEDHKMLLQVHINRWVVTREMNSHRFGEFFFSKLEIFPCLAFLDCKSLGCDYVTLPCSPNHFSAKL